MDLIETFQDLIAQVPDLLQPLIVALAAAVPFIEGEGAAGIGILGGIHPVIAVIAAIIGNFVCVAVLVLASSGARRAIVTRRRDRTNALSTAGDSTAASVESEEYALTDTTVSPRKEKFQRALLRYGVPGVSLLGPLLLPTQFTATMLAAAGVGRTRILLWQAVAIICWTTMVALLMSSVVFAVLR